jgi:hypothetical protein
MYGESKFLDQFGTNKDIGMIYDPESKKILEAVAFKYDGVQDYWMNWWAAKIIPSGCWIVLWRFDKDNERWSLYGGQDESRYPLNETAAEATILFEIGDNSFIYKRMK